MTDLAGFSLHSALSESGQPVFELHHKHRCGVVETFGYPSHLLDEVLTTARLHMRDCPEWPRD